jgi:hypothetical protein
VGVAEAWQIGLTTAPPTRIPTDWVMAIRADDAGRIDERW